MESIQGFLTVLRVHTDVERLTNALTQLNVRLTNPQHVTEEVIESVVSGELETLLLSVLLTFPDSPSIQSHVFNIIDNILMYDYLDYDRSDQQVRDWLDLLYTTMSTHMDRPHVQDACCRVLTRLVDLYPQLHQNIGENPDVYQYPLHNLCFGAILMHVSDVSVVVSACSALYSLSADQAVVQTLLVEKNVHVAISHCMRIHQMEALVQEAGCRALRGLAIFSEENKEKLAWDLRVEDIFSLLISYSDHPDVLTEAIALTATLADTELVRSKCMVGEVYENILVAMESHERAALLHEVTMETLAILCAAEGGAALLNECKAVDKVLITMRLHKHSQVIQKKSLVLIQLLVDDLDLGDLVSVAHDVINVMVSAMTCHRDDVGLLTEACVLMVILIETWPPSGEQLVHSEALTLLFFILKHFTHFTNLVDTASECIYLLSSSDNKLRSQMLRLAAAQGNTQGVECMVTLGGDVNSGVTNDTPLCHACRHGDRHMVTLLLHQGVTDLQTPLQVALQAGNDDITGLILHYHGYDRQAGMVSWSGLDLTDLRPEWMELTFLTTSSTDHQVSECGTMMAQRVRESEERRKRRQGRHHAGDRRTNEAETPQSLPLRYSFSSYRTLTSTDLSVADLQDVSTDHDSAPQRAAPDGPGAGQSGPLAFIKRAVLNLTSRQDKGRDMSQDKGREMGRDKGDKGRARTKSDLIKSISSTKLALLDREGYPGVGRRSVEVCEFIQCEEEVREWKEQTVTGCNVPYCPRDPRRAGDDPRRASDDPRRAAHDPRRPAHDDIISQEAPGKWRRKSAAGGIPRRRSDSMLMMYKTNGALKSPSFTSLQGHDDDDDSSSASLHGSNLSISECNHGNSRSPWPRPPGRTRALSLRARRTSSRDDMSRPLSTIKDEGTSLPPSSRPSLPLLLGAGEENEGEEGETMNRSSSDLQFAAARSRIVGSRRCRSVTIGDTSSVVTSGRDMVHLDVSNNKIMTLDHLVAESSTNLLHQLRVLQKVDVSHNIINTPPDALIKYLVNVEMLNLSDNRLPTLPTSVFSCRHLSHLNLSHNQMDQVDLLGKGVSMSIKVLDLSHNALESFPKGLAKALPRLTSLSLQGNKISALPGEPLVLTSLRMLDLSYNYIRVLPDLLLTQTPGLETLIMTSNQIDTLPSEEVALALPKLSIVKLAHNNLACKEPFYIHKFILQLASLRSVYLDHNGLEGLAEPSLWRSAGLRDIHASHNNIKHLNLGSEPRLWASSLERLSLSHNKLQELSKDVGHLTSLTSLDVSHNERLVSVPDELGRLQQLWEFPLDGLKLDLDENLMKGKTKDLIGYLHEKLKRSVEYYHMKLMVVGYGGRGKSTLLRSLMRQRHPEKSSPTVGVVVRDWKLRGRGRKPGQGHVTYTLSTWDFAGQEEFYATHQCFLSRRALYLVVYNLAGGVSEVAMLRPWLLSIQARAPNCPVIVVATHLDQIPAEEREDRVSEVREAVLELCEGAGYPDVKDLIEVTCTQENASLERLRDLIREALHSYKINGQPAMGQKIPESYVRLQDLLSAEASNLRTSLPIIKHARLVKIARDAGLALDEDELHQAVRFLHESGSLLHYDDSTLHLNTYYFIDPEWLCRMMAQVVTVREINPFITKQGILKREHVALLFTGKRVGSGSPYTFPTYLIPHYIKLLEKFEIVLPQSESTLLVPCRLPVQRPVLHHPLPIIDRSVNHSLSPAPDSAHLAVERRYELSYTPIGFWPRLLTRLLVFINTTIPQLNVGGRVPEETQCWREGIYVYYAKDAYFLVASDQLGSQAISILVPASRPGSRLLGELVDHIDTVIEEWYPGLDDVTPTGVRLVTRKAPCPGCHDYVFELEELLSLSELNDSAECPVHRGLVPLSLLAPDIVLADLEERYRLDEEDLVLVQSPEFILGDGTFGCVYRARYKNQAVAAKLYNMLCEAHPYKLMRQEACILRRLHHPSLLSMVGVSLHPRLLLLELAPLGALGSLLKSQRAVSRPLQHRIASQVCDGLSFLHGQHIIYRDMKPDNILVFNLSLTAAVNVKISDYGISRLVTACGLTSPEGTPGYRSPQVITGEPYTCQADIYSLGITLYELVTGGQHPFSHLRFRSEIDDAIVRGRRVESVRKHGAGAWPDMEDLIERCLQQVPEARPTAGQMVSELSRVDFLCLRRAVAVSKQVSVDCMAVRGYGESDLEVWMVSGDQYGSQLSWLNLTAHGQEPKGMMLMGSQIVSMTTVGQSYVLLGSVTGCIYVYDAWRHRHLHSLCELHQPVLTLQHYTGYQDQDYVFAGLGNGKLAVYNTQHVLKDRTCEPRYLQIGRDADRIEVTYLDTSSRRLYVTSGSDVSVVRLEPRLDVERCFNTRLSQSPEIISELIIVNKYAHIAKRGKSTVEKWHLSKYQLQQTRDISLLNDTCGECHVTAMIHVARSSCLWVGTGGATIVLLHAATYDHLATLNRHTAAVTCLCWARVFDRFSLVLSGGIGCTSSSQQGSTENGNHGYLLLWDTDIPQQQKSLRDYERRREEWAEQNKPEGAGLEEATPTQTENEKRDKDKRDEKREKEGSKKNGKPWRRALEKTQAKNLKEPQLRSTASSSPEAKYHRRQSKGNHSNQRQTTGSHGDQRQTTGSHGDQRQTTGSHGYPRQNITQNMDAETGRGREERRKGRAGKERGRAVETGWEGLDSPRRQGWYGDGRSQRKRGRREVGVPIPGTEMGGASTSRLGSLEEGRVSDGGVSQHGSTRSHMRRKHSKASGSPRRGGANWMSDRQVGGADSMGRAMSMSDSPVGGAKSVSDSPVGGAKSISDSPVGGAKSMSGSPVGGAKSMSGSPVGGIQFTLGASPENRSYMKCGRSSTSLTE